MKKLLLSIAFLLPAMGMMAQTRYQELIMGILKLMGVLAQQERE